jgi:hypothetical protein
MTTFQDFINVDFLNWLQNNKLKHEVANINVDKGALHIIYTDKFSLKIYDRLGHGFGISANVADKYDESIYDNDIFNLSWAFKYFNIPQTASFSGRTENQYRDNLPRFLSDLKNILVPLNNLTELEWDNMKSWINNEVKKQFAQ